MPWLETDGRKYFYRAVRKDGRPRNVYVGGGLAGQLAALEVEERKVRLQRERAETRHFLAESEPIARVLKNLAKDVQLLVRAELLSNGYYQHNRSEWRRRGQLNSQAA